mmetsp:Transcript_1447/g.3192  ORF Transcript_1447/g.3192 Transcript_1447/m.3192 type:complete len:87 (-) Transcript_1447:3869-4129(-)
MYTIYELFDCSQFLSPDQKCTMIHTLGNKRCMSCGDADLEVKSFSGMHRQESLMTYATTFRSKRYTAWFQRVMYMPTWRGQRNHQC